ncbi:MAG TPA: tetratricopeptide repeat protein [Terriglobales bacterium]|nr:tetratricopeptide repeat protein [Terriglobales bacterium]
MKKALLAASLVFFLIGWTLAQSTPTSQSAPKNQAPPRSDEPSSDDPHFPAGESSSSKNTNVDISPPKDDAQKHPFSSTALADSGVGDVQEFHPWDPHRAAKNVEVGDFYFKRKNYRAAADRYREALVYKPDDAIATFRLAQTEEKLGDLDEARTNYQAYLKILPEGPFAADAHKALERINK